MLGKLRCVFILCLMAILWPLSVCSMNQTDNDNDKRLPPFKIPDQTITLEISKCPVSYEFLIKKYSWDNPKDPQQSLLNLVKPLPKGEGLLEAEKALEREFPGQNIQGPPITPKTLLEAQKDFETKCAEYKTAAERYERQQTDDRKEALEKIQIWFLRKFASVERIRQLNEILEKTNYRTEHDISEIFKTEIEAIRKIVRKVPIISSTLKESSKSGFYIEPDELKIMTEKIKKLKFIFEREHNIQGQVKIDYEEKYLSKVSNWGPTQCINWYWDEPRKELEAHIKSSMKERYPYNVYSIHFIDAIDNINSLKPTKESTIYVYRKNDEIYFYNNKKEIKIEKTEKTCPSGLGKKIYGQIIETFQENDYPSSEIEMNLLNFVSICGYFPDSFCAQETAKWVRKQKHIQETLQGRGKWSKKLPLQPLNFDFSVINPLEGIEVEQKIELFDEDEYDNLIKEYYILPKYDGDKPVVKQKPVSSENSLPKTVYHFIPEREKYPHKKKTISVLKELHGKRKFVSSEQEKFSLPEHKTYNKKEVEEYLIIYEELENLLKVHLPQQKVLDTKVSRTIPGSYSVYQSEAYVEDEMPESINLSFLKLSDESFFTRFTERKCGLDKFKVINLSHNHLAGERGPTFAEDLEGLFVNNNYLFSLKFIRDLKKLQILDISFNQLESLNTLETCTSLTHLDLSHNSLTIAPELVYSLSNLTILNVSSNKMTNLLFFEDLRNLTKLDISHNNFSRLQPLSNFFSLIYLKANDNQFEGGITNISKDPNELSGSNVFSSLWLPQLCFLDIGNNNNLAFCNIESKQSEKNYYNQYFPKLTYLKLPNATEFTWD